MRDDEHPFRHILGCRTCQIGWYVVLVMVGLVIWAGLQDAL